MEARKSLRGLRAQNFFVINSVTLSRVRPIARKATIVIALPKISDAAQQDSIAREQEHSTGMRTVTPGWPRGRVLGNPLLFNCMFLIILNQDMKGNIQNE